MGSVDMGRITRYAELDERRLSLMREIDSLRKAQSEMEPQILEDMSNSGMESTRVNGRTIYIQRQLWAKYSNAYDAVEALKEAGLEDLVSEKFNANQLAAYIRELDAQGEPMPTEFQGIIEPNEVFHIRTRRA
jgi:hypothetical protein